MAEQEPKKDPKPAAELADEAQDHGGGGRFNRRLLMSVSVFAVVVGIAAVEGIRSAGVKATSVAAQHPADDGADPSRDKAEVAELAPGATPPQAAPNPPLPPTFIPTPPPQPPFAPTP